MERATPEKVLREGTLILVFVFALCFPLCVPPGFCLGSGELSPYLMGGPFVGPLLSACPGFYVILHCFCHSIVLEVPAGELSARTSYHSRNELLE